MSVHPARAHAIAASGATAANAAAVAAAVAAAAAASAAAVPKPQAVILPPTSIRQFISPNNQDDE